MSRTKYDEAGPDIPAFVCTDKEIKKHWIDLQNTAESLLFGNAPVIYGCSDSDFVITNWGKTVAHLLREYKKFHKPDPTEIEEAARKSGRSSQEVQADYLEAVEQAFWRHSRSIIYRQFLQKMSEARSKFIIELTDQVCKLLNGQKIQTSIDSDFHFTYTDQLKKALEKAQKRIQKMEKLRMGARGPGHPRKHEWSKQDLADFVHHHELLSRKWNKAVKGYRKIPLRREDPEKRCAFVQGEYPELPYDLIQRIPNGADAYELALEHAARLSGAPDNLYTSRQLRKCK